MSLNQEYGNEKQTSAGISGDNSVDYETGSAHEVAGRLAMQAFMNQLYDLLDTDQVTHTERTTIINTFAHNQAHGYN